VSHAISDDRRLLRAVMVEAWAMVDSWRRLGAGRAACRAQLRTRRHASSGRPTCRGIATYVRGRQPARRPDGRSGRSIGPDSEPTAAEARGIPAGRKQGRKKPFAAWPRAGATAGLPVSWGADLARWRRARCAAACCAFISAALRRSACRRQACHRRRRRRHSGSWQ